jgi:hypothetical protein
MAAKTYYLLGTATDTNYPVTGANGWWGRLQEGGTAPTAANSAYGYAPGKLATSNFARSRLGATGTSATTSASSFIDSTSGPTAGTGAAGTTSGDSFCTPTALSGTFANTAWTFALNMRAGVAGLNGIMRCRVWKSANADGSSATALTGSTLVTSAAAALSTSADTNLGFTWSPGAITLTNQYLFFQLEWKESATTAGSSNTDTALFRINTSTITTPSFANAYALAANSGTFALTGNAAALSYSVFDPSQMTSVLAWFDPKQGVTLSSGNVSSWVDAAKGVTASQGTASLQPGFSSTAMNDFPGITLADRSAAFRLAASGIASQTPMTVIAVGNASTVPSGDGATMSSSSLSGGIQMSIDSNQHLNVTKTVIANIGSGTAVVTPGYAIYVWQIDSSNWWTRVNGSADSGPNTNAQGAMSGGTLVLFSNADANAGNPLAEGWVGQVGDIIIAGVVSSTTEIQKAEGYLAWKYNLTTLLPSGHPYKNNPPGKAAPKFMPPRCARTTLRR